MDFFSKNNYLSSDSQKIYEFRLQYCRDAAEVFNLLLDFIPSYIMPIDFIKHMAIEEFNKLVERATTNPFGVGAQSEGAQSEGAQSANE